MSFELRAFQEEAVQELLGYFAQARIAREHTNIKSAIGLAATTGAGKTVIASSVIEAVLFGSDRFDLERDEKAVFLWITDLPELNTQTQEKMMVASSRLRHDMLPIVQNNFAEEMLTPGRVYFLNTQLLSKAGLLTKEGPTLGRDSTFWDVIRNTVEADDRILYLVIDEAHRGMTEGRALSEANSIIQRFIKGYPEGGMPPVPIIWGISATPQRFNDMIANTGRAPFACEVSPEAVRASGLIKERTVAEYAGERQTDALALFPDAVKRWSEMSERWAAYHDDRDGEEGIVVPAFIIQVENEGKEGEVSQTDIAALIKAINNAAGPFDDAAFAHAFGDHSDALVGDRTVRYLEPSKIASDPDARVVFYKEALGTGWDCPRAEVMFSFRRAVDIVSIAQTIGRMVRAPLARRIEEDALLNAAHLYLPHYDSRAVTSIIEYLDKSGNRAVADTIETGRASVTLPLRNDMPEAVAAIEKLPSYVVPVGTKRSPLKFLMKMANFLASRGIDSEAKTREAQTGADMLVGLHKKLASDAAFKQMVNDQGEIVIEVGETMVGDGRVSYAGTKVLTASEGTIDREFAKAKAKLTPEIAMAYVVTRKNAGQSIRSAKLEARALIERGSVLSKLTEWASERVDDLRDEHSGAIEELSPKQRSQYFESIAQSAPSPTERALNLPPNAVFKGGDDDFPNHLYASGGEAQIALGSTWERDALAEAHKDPGFVGWLRNVERAPWALRLPRREGNEWRPFFPDILVVRRDGEQLVVDILDPHDHTREDAVTKAKGLSEYAGKHGDKVKHVDYIAKIDGHYFTLHMERSTIRTAVNSLGDSDTKALAQLFKSRGG